MQFLERIAYVPSESFNINGLILLFSSRIQPVLTPELKGRKGPNGRGLHRPPPHTSLPVPLHAIVPQDVAPSNLWQTWFLWSRKIIAQYMMRSNSRRQKAFSSSLSLSHTHTYSDRNAHTHTHTHNMQIYNILLAKHEIRGHMRHQIGTTLILHCLITVLEILFPY